MSVPKDGILVCNGDNAGARRMAVEYPAETTLLYGLDPSLGALDCIAENIRTTKEGMEFDIKWNGLTYAARCPLVGKAAVSNVLGSFLMAATLGADPQTLIAGISQLEPIENRLERKHFNGSTHLRDGYNSNPQGFLAALEQLRDEPGDRRILITPGMIELGDEQKIENTRVAKEAAAVVDLAFIVGSTNRSALVEGLREGGKVGEAVLLFDTRDQAFAKLSEIQKPGDIVLIENDLPDLFEAEVRF